MVKSNSHELVEKHFEKVRSVYPIHFLSDESIKRLLIATKDEGHLNSLFYFLSKSLKSSPDKKASGAILFTYVDDSEYELSQWIEAIAYFKIWLDENSRETSFEKVLGYISCCTSSPENKTIKFKLIDILKDMLKTHGFNG